MMPAAPSRIFCKHADMDVALCSIVENNAGNRLVIVDETNPNSASRIEADRIQMLRGPGNYRRIVSNDLQGHGAVGQVIL